MDNPFRPTEKYSRRTLAVTAVFSFLGIMVLAALDRYVDNQWVVASFGSTAVLIYAAPKAPFSKPKNVMFGHIFSAMISMAIVFVFDTAGVFDDLHFIVMGLCVMSAILLMMLTGTIHPPAGATALTVAISGITDPSFLVFPLVLGLLVMLALAYGANYLKDGEKR